MRLSTLALAAAQLIAPVVAWGDEGHKITATIAQIYLLPSTQKAICGILPSNYSCSLAQVATWPDEIKKETGWEWSAGLHFLNGVGDSPPERCTFGDSGWSTEKNILQAIVDNTRDLSRLSGDKQDIALRFLTHFLGDVHQPLHLTGRNRGGNLVPVLYEGRETNLHFTWDDLFILYRIRNLKKHKEPLPTNPDAALPAPIILRNKHIESVLDGSNYDPLVRWIVVDGINGWWAGDYQSWIECPTVDSHSEGGQAVMGKRPFDDPTDLPVCPYHWSVPSHQLVCDFIWRPDFEGVERPEDAVFKIELEPSEYAEKVRKNKIIEKQLALGGLRLAAALNSVLADSEEKELFGVLPSLI